MTSARLSLAPLLSAEQTADQMARLVHTYAKDIGDRAKWPLIRFFDFVKNLPYRADPPGNETIARPALTMRPEWPARDCDDKAILLASWCECNGVPWRFVASSTRPDKVLHHVYLVARLGGPNGRETVLDATYPENVFGSTPHGAEQTRRVFLNGWQMNTLSVFEGAAAPMGFSFKKLARKTKSAVKTGARVASRPVASSVKATQKLGTAVKSGSVTKIARATKNAALAPTRDLKRNGAAVASGIGRVMPGALKTAIKKAVGKVAGDNVTLATKAALLPAATAAALAIPGAQPFAPAVGAVVNVALDELIAKGKNTAKRAAVGAVRQATAPAKKTAQATAQATAKARAAALKAKMQAATAQATAQATAKARAASLKAKMQAATAQAADVAAQAAESAPATGIDKRLLIGGGAAGLAALLMLSKGRRK